MNALLLLLLDSRAPAGGHSHSGGMEATVAAADLRTVNDVEDFCRARLRTNARVAAAFAGYACHLWTESADCDRWAQLDQELQARTPSPAMRTASRQLGSGLRRLLTAMAPQVNLRTPWAGCTRPAPHHALVLGAGVAIAGGDVELAARAAALSACTAPASAAVRLLGLDPFAVQRMLAQLTPQIDRLSRETAELIAADPLPADLPADAAPALDLLADYHITTEVRLFAS